MKIRNLSEAGGRRQLNAATLIEVIGALIVIALLLAATIPPTINTINWSKAINAVGSYQGLMTAATNHAAAYGSFDVCFNPTNWDDPTPALRTNWDATVLLPEGFLDRKFWIKVGTNSVVQVQAGGRENGGVGYKLNGVNDCTSGYHWVVEIVVTGVTPENAYDVSWILDGSSFTPTNTGGVDTLGKITYNPTNRTMYMYVAGS